MTLTNPGNGSVNGSFYGGSLGWGIYANSGETSSAKSVFSSISGAPLTTVSATGDSVSIDFDHGDINGGGATVGVQFFDGANVNSQVAELYFAGPTGGLGTYKINDSASGFDTGLLNNTSPFTLKLTLDNTSGGYSMQVGATLFSGRTLGGGAQSIGAIRVYNYQAGNASSNDGFFNNLTLAQAVPEVSSLAAMSVAASLSMAIGVYWRQIRHRVVA